MRIVRINSHLIDFRIIWSLRGKHLWPFLSWFLDLRRCIFTLDLVANTLSTDAHLSPTRWFFFNRTSSLKQILTSWWQASHFEALSQCLRRICTTKSQFSATSRVMHGYPIRGLPVPVPVPADRGAGSGRVLRSRVRVRVREFPFLTRGFTRPRVTRSSKSTHNL